MAKFGFDVVARARVTVDAAEARAARGLIERALDGVTAKVVTEATDAGDGLELVGVHLATTPALVSIDGIDPLLPVAEALRAYRDAADGSEPTS